MELNSLTKITQARLIRLRWLSVLAMGLAALFSPAVTESAQLLPQLLAVATVVACLNACLMLLDALGSTKIPMHRWFSPALQLSFDVISWGIYLYLSGGAGNPMISIFLPLVAIGAIALPKLQAWSLVLATIVIYTLLWRLYQPLHIADTAIAARIHVLGVWSVFVASAMVVTWFTLQMTRAVRSRDAQLAQAREQAIRDDWLISMGSLAAGAAHDLSTPLATLSLLIEEQQRHPGMPAELQSDLALMQRQIKVCKQALAHLTQRAGSPRGGESAHLPLADWLHASLNAWQALHPQVSVHCGGLEATSACHLPQDLLLERAFASLLDNAAKAGATQVEVRVRCTGQQLHLALHDNGHGISASVMSNFNAGLPNPSEKGLGIGLLLARGTLERRGGRLQLHANPEGGSWVEISLPWPWP